MNCQVVRPHRQRANRLAGVFGTIDENARIGGVTLHLFGLIDNGLGWQPRRKGAQRLPDVVREPTTPQRHPGIARSQGNLAAKQADTLVHRA